MSPVATYTVALDPSAVIANRTELKLNEGAIGITAPQDIDWGEAQIKAFMAEQLYGEVPSSFRIPNRQVSIPLFLGAGNVTEAEAEEARRKLEEKVALIQRKGGVLLRQRANGEPLYADIVTAGLTVPDVYGEGGGVEPGVTLKLECLPDFYGEEITLEAMAEGTGYTIGVLKESGSPAVIKGDYPARTRIQLVEKANKNQRTLLWGIRALNNGESGVGTNALFFNASSMTPINEAVSETHSGTYNGKWVKLNAPLTNTWYPFLETNLSSGTEPLTHIGTYRVWARVVSGVTGQRCRFAWGNDDASEATNNPSVLVPTTEGSYQLIDLGEIRIEEPPVGEHWWRGVFQVETGPTSAAFAVDAVWFQPIDAGAGRLRATAKPTSLALKQSKEPPKKAENSGAGAAWKEVTKLQENHFVEIKTLASKEASQIAKMTEWGFALPVGATVLGIEVTGDQGPGRIGGHEAEPEGTVQLYKEGTLAGEEKHVNNPEGAGGVGSFKKGGPTDLWGTTWTVAQINAATTGLAFVANKAKIGYEGPYEIGKFTIIVYYTAGGSAITQDAVLYGDRTSEIRFDGSYREDTTTGAYVRVSEETGALARIPPSGLEKDEIQLFAKNSRGLIASGSEEGEPDPAIDKFQVTVKYRPCYIGRI